MIGAFNSYLLNFIIIFLSAACFGPIQHQVFQTNYHAPIQLTPKGGGRAKIKYFKSSQNMTVVACSCTSNKPLYKDAATQTEPSMNYAVSTQMPDKSPFQYLVQSVFPSRDTVRIQVRTPPRWSSPTAIESKSPCY